MKKTASLLSLLFFVVCNMVAQMVVINEMASSNTSVNADMDGEYSDWVELYNNSNVAVNLNGYGLSDDGFSLFKWTFPSVTIQPNTYLLVWASGKNRKTSELHSNFSIKSSGEKIWLTLPNGTLLDTVPAKFVASNFSLGRWPNGTGAWTTLAKPTPNNANDISTPANQCNTPSFSLKAGYYNGTIVVSALSDMPQATLYYTTDGAVPTELSKKADAPISISKTTTLRVCAFAPDYLPSKIATNTYFIDESFTFPVVSITTDPFNLYDKTYGIFPYSNPYQDSNLFQDWERPIHFQFFETNKQSVVNMDAGVKVHGGLTRNVEGKSLSIMARNSYGSDSINHKFFAEKELASFKNVVLRNGGNDYNYALLRDCYMQALVRDKMDLDLSGSRPSIVFLNGEYWGIRDIKEKINEHFIARNFNVDTESIDLLEYVHHNNAVLSSNGSPEHFNALIHFIEQNDVTIAENFDYVNTQIDIKNYIQYQLAQIYFDNSDWPGNNIKWWRQNKPESRYRWLLFDTDFGFSLSPFGKEKGDELLHYKHNTLDIATDVAGPEWPNPPHSTYLFRSLLRNEDFKQQFINTFCDHLNATFLPTRVLGILNDYLALFTPEIEKHRLRFPSKYKWSDEINKIKTFGELRPNYIYPQLMQKFGLQRIKIINLNVDDVEKGDILVNSMICSNYPWSGKYFPRIPIKIRAIAKPGHRFTSWSDGNTDTERMVDVNDVQQLTAQFSTTGIGSEALVINEINFSSALDFDTDDWVELLNNSEQWADISEWIFKDQREERRFVISQGTMVAPHQTVVLCAQQTKFKSLHPSIKNTVGNVNFGFSSLGETLRLYKADGTLIDSVAYGVSAPWPTFATNEGHTLQLIDAHTDNALAINWKKSENKGGNPGKKNQEEASALKTLRTVDSYLSQNFPNPFHYSTQINYRVAHTGAVRIDVLNVAGQIIKTLVDSNHSSGAYVCEWNCTNSTGNKVEPGIYLYRIAIGNSIETKKMVYIR